MPEVCRSFRSSGLGRVNGHSGAPSRTDQSDRAPATLACLGSVLLAFVILLSAACKSRHTAAAPAVPRPDPAQGTWVDLRPQMELRVENAYYKEGALKRGLAGFLGTEIARYQVRRAGLRLMAVEAVLTQRPRDQLPVQQLLPTSKMRYRYYRFFYAVVFSKRREEGGAVLLGARSTDELGRLGARLLSDPESICTNQSNQCTVFPPACTVALEIEIVVNGAPRTVSWGSLLATLEPKPEHFELLRRSASGLDTPLEIDFNDPRALRTPLMPGDQINWK